jgi:hypothetical protein
MGLIERGREGFFANARPGPLKHARQNVHPLDPAINRRATIICPSGTPVIGCSVRPKAARKLARQDIKQSVTALRAASYPERIVRTENQIRRLALYGACRDVPL